MRKNFIHIAIGCVAIIIIISLCLFYTSKIRELRSLYEEEVLNRNKIAEIMPIMISNIQITNEVDGNIINEPRDTFLRKDIRHIACRFTIVNNNWKIKDIRDINEEVMIKFITPSGVLMQYSGGYTSPDRYTTSENIENRKETMGLASVGTSTGTSSLNTEEGQYIIEFWYQDKQIYRTAFDVI